VKSTKFTPDHEKKHHAKTTGLERMINPFLQAKTLFYRTFVSQEWSFSPKVICHSKAKQKLSKFCKKVIIVDRQDDLTIMTPVIRI
jgi:hypothetical protein